MLKRIRHTEDLQTKQLEQAIAANELGKYVNSNARALKHT